MDNHIMTLGSLPEWLSGIGCIVSAIIVLVLYSLDRSRNRSEKLELLRHTNANRAQVVIEFQTLASKVLVTLDEAQEQNSFTEDNLKYCNGILKNYQARFRELMYFIDRQSYLSLTIGRAAHILDFSNLPLEHLQIWRKDISIANVELLKLMEDFT